MIKVCANFEISNFTSYEDIKKAMQNVSKMGVIEAVRSHSRSSAMSHFDRAHTTSCSLLLRMAQGWERKKERKGIAVCATSTAPLRKLTYHMGSHSVTCHPAEVTFPSLSQPIKAGTRFSDPRGMQG